MSFKTFISTIICMAVASAQVLTADVLVYEGFDAGDYSLGATDCTTLSEKTLTAQTVAIGTSNSKWAGMGGSQVKVYGTDYGLTFPDEMVRAGYTSVGGSVGLNPTGGSSDLRAMEHSLASGVLNVSSGKLYVRMLLKADSVALSKLQAKASAGSSYFGFGLCTYSSGNVYTLLTSTPSSLAFVIWKRTSGEYVLSLTVTDTAKGLHVYDIRPVTAGETYLCYAEVSVNAGIDGEELIRAGAMTAADFTLRTPWAMIDGDTDTVQCDFITSSSYPNTMAVAGPYQTGSGRFCADELCVGTEIEDVLATPQDTPRLGEVSMVWNADGTCSVTAEMEKNSASVGALAKTDPDDAAPVVAPSSPEIAEGSSTTVTISGFAADKTYQVFATAANNAGAVTNAVDTLYTGTLTMTKVSDAAEIGLVPAEVTISRASADPYPLEVFYGFSSATPGAAEGQTWAAPQGALIIPANAASASVFLNPLLDMSVEQDAVVTLCITNGFFPAVSQTVDLVISNAVAPAGYNTWIAPAGSDKMASNGANWSYGRAPLETDDVLFDGYLSSVDCIWDETAVSTVASWTQRNGYAGAVTVATTFPEKTASTAFQTLTVTGAMNIDSGILTHPQSWTMGEKHDAAWAWLDDLLANETYRLCLSVGSLYVGANGRIDAMGKGYYASHDGSRAPMPAHGGRSSGFAPYGDPKNPVHIGLPCRTAGNYYNGKGGGAVYILCSGAAVIDGVISADSGDNTLSYGSGAAGSVYLRAASVSGTGTVSANGSASKDGNIKGTGGRVAVYSEQAPVDYSTLRLTATVAAINSQNKLATTQGSCGTVYLKDSTMTNGILLIDNIANMPTQEIDRRVVEPTAEGDWTFDAVGLGHNAVLALPVGTEIHLPNGLDSVFSLNAASEANLGSIRYEGGTLDIGDAAEQTMAGAWIFTGWTNFVFNCDLMVKDGAILGCPTASQLQDNNGAGLAPFLSCTVTVNGDLTIETNGLARVMANGFFKARNDTEVGLLGYLSHGGRTIHYGQTQKMHYQGYDSVFNPSLPGCDVPEPNGQGHEPCGGVLTLTVSGCLTVNGKLNANGTPESYNQGGNDAGGVGGSINVTAGSLAGSGDILAEGGAMGWQRGAGGRIAVKLTDAGAGFDAFTGFISASGRSNDAAKDWKCDGSAGTVYLQAGDDKPFGGTMLIKNRNLFRYSSAVNSNTTEIVSLGYGGDKVSDYRRVSLLVSDYGRAAVNTDVEIAAVSVVDNTAFIDLEGHTLEVTSASLVRDGVPARVTAGTYSAERLADLGYTSVYDSVGGGSFVVKALGTIFLVQ